MKKKNISRKTIVFWTVHGTLSIFLLLILFFASTHLTSLGGPIVWALVMNAGAYGGLRVLNSLQRSMNYHWELDDNMITADMKVGGSG